MSNTTSLILFFLIISVTNQHLSERHGFRCLCNERKNGKKELSNPVSICSDWNVQAIRPIRIETIEVGPVYTLHLQITKPFVCLGTSPPLSPGRQHLNHMLTIRTTYKKDTRWKNIQLKPWQRPMKVVNGSEEKSLTTGSKADVRPGEARLAGCAVAGF